MGGHLGMILHAEGILEGVFLAIRRICWRFPCVCLQQFLSAMWNDSSQVALQVTTTISAPRYFTVCWLSAICGE